MNGRYSIEAVTDLDAVWPTLVTLFLEFEDYNRGFLARSLRFDWEQRWREHLELTDDRLILLARAEGEAIGYLVASVVRDHGLFQEVYAHVSDLFVRSDYRDANLGRALAKRAEEWSTSRGAEEVRIEVFSANKPGVRFWTYSGYGLDMMAMTRSLKGASQ